MASERLGAGNHVAVGVEWGLGVGSSVRVGMCREQRAYRRPCLGTPPLVSDRMVADASQVLSRYGVLFPTEVCSAADARDTAPNGGATGVERNHATESTNRR